MSKKFVMCTVMAMTLLTSLGWVMAMRTGVSEGSPLKLSLTRLPDVNYTVSHIPLKVTFKNISKKELRMLSAFRQPELVRIFFRLSIKTSDGTPMQSLGGGKIAFSRESQQYIVLEKGQKTDMVVDVAEYFSKTKLKAGIYDFSLVYGNQYGSDCFQGNVESNTVRVNLGD